MRRFRLPALLCMLALAALPSAASADTSFSQLTSQFEQQYGLPSGLLGKVAQIESGGNPNAGNPNSAYGLYQWLPNSWLAASKALYGQPIVLSARTNVTVSTAVTAFALADAKSKLGTLITQSGINMSVGLYMAHFLGIGGAQHFISDYIQGPGQSACALFPKECSYNQSILGNRTLAQVVNYFAGKMQVAGVTDIAGNFQDSTGVSYAYSSAYLNSGYFLPAGTAIGVDPQYDYPATFTTVAQQPASISSATMSGAPLSNAPQQTSLPTSYTTPSTAAAALAAASNTASTTSATSSLSCTPQYFCSNDTLTYESSSCTTQVMQMCQYGCSGTMCAAATSSPSSVASLFTSAPNIVTTVWQAFTPASTTGAGQGFPFGSNLYTVVNIGSPAPENGIAAATSDILAGNEAYAQETFAPNYSQDFPAAATPLSGLFTQLQNALAGLLVYLYSL